MPTEAAELPDLIRAYQESGDEARVGTLWDTFERWERPHRLRRGEWTKLNAMVHGDQWTDYTNDGRRRRDYLRDDILESRVQYNRIIISSEQFRSLTSQERPDFGFTTATSEGNDRASAVACEQASRYLWRDHDLETAYADTAQGGFNLGGHFIHLRMDMLCGKPVTREEGTGKFTDEEFTDDPLVGEILTKPSEEITKTIEEFQGQHVYEQCTPDQVVYNPEASVLRGAHAVFLVQYMTPWEVYRRWPDKYEEVQFGIPSEFSSGLSGRYLDFRGSGTRTGEDETEVAVIITNYMRQCPEYPRGKMVIFGTGVELETGDNPYYPLEDEPDLVWSPNDPQWCPIFQHAHYRDPRHVHGRAPASDLVDPQTSLNGKKSKSLLIIKKVAHAGLLVPRGTPHIDTDDPSAIVEYDRRDGPDSIKWMEPPRYPSEIAMEWQDDALQMNDISGANAAIQGKSNADESGKKVEALQGRAQGRYSEVKARLDRMFARVMQFSIRLMVRHWTEDITVTVVGANNRAEVRTLQMANLSASVDVYPINDPLSSDPFQRSLQLENVTRTIQQVQGDTVLQNRLIAAQGLEEVLYIQDSMTVHRDKALMENERIARGETPFLSPYDDDDVHIAELVTFGLSQDGIRKMTPEPNDPPEVLQRKQQLAALYEQHLKGHEDQKMRKMGIDPATGLPLQPNNPPDGGGTPPNSAPYAQAPSPEMQRDQGIATPQQPISSGV